MDTMLDIGSSSRWNRWSGVMSDAMFRLRVNANVREMFDDLTVEKNDREILEILCNGDDIFFPDRHIDVVTKPHLKKGGSAPSKMIGVRLFWIDLWSLRGTGKRQGSISFSLSTYSYRAEDMTSH